MEQVKLLSMTAVLTLVVWVSADSLVNEAVSIGVTFEVVPAAGTSDMIVSSASPMKRYEVQVSGPRRIVEGVGAQAPFRVRLPIPDQPTGPAVIQLDRDMLKREMASQWNEFRKLTIISTSPATLTVQADHWITKKVDLVLNRLTLAYDVEPQLRQSSVTVRMRQSRLDQLPDREQLQLNISSDVERLLKEQPAGQSVTIPVTLDNQAFGAGAEFSPGQVYVTATVKAERTTRDIATVPILFAVSSANLEKRVRPVTQDGAPLSVLTRTITVTGPTDAVTRLLHGSDRAYGIIHLKQADLEELGQPKLVTPDYHLPPGIVLAKEPAPVEFKLMAVPAPAGHE